LKKRGEFQRILLSKTTFCGIAGNKTQFSISVDNQRFILQKLRDCCGIFLQTAIFLRLNLLPVCFRLLRLICGLLSESGFMDIEITRLKKMSTVDFKALNRFPNSQRSGGKEKLPKERSMI
jgi:hypothetical protein